MKEQDLECVYITIYKFLCNYSPYRKTAPEKTSKGTVPLGPYLISTFLKPSPSVCEGKNLQDCKQIYLIKTKYCE